MRIIGGSVGGRKIRAPRGQATRPTSDRVREALFSILGPPGEGLRVLDLFAGAGGLGLEALSRGAAQAVFVDRAIVAVRCIQANAEVLGLGERVIVVRAEVHDVLLSLARAAETFGWIFIDPPYAGNESTLTLDTLGDRAASLVAAAGVVVVEHDRKNAPAETHGGLALVDRRRYGDTEVSFYRRSA